MSSQVSSAVISEAVSRITSLLTGKYSEHNDVHEWIHRLEMARIKIKSAVQESEAFDIDIDGALHEWQEKLKVAVCEAEQALSNFQAKILHEKPNPTVEGGSSACDQLMQEEGHDDATLGLPASNLREAVPRQVELERNIPHDQFMQEEVSDDATWVHPASNLSEAVNRQVDLEENLPHDPFMQEEGSDDATLVNPASNLRDAISRQVNVEANLPHDPFMQEEGSDDATLVHPATNLREAVNRQVDLEENLPHDPFMLDEGSDDATLVNPASNLREAITRQVNVEANLPHDQFIQDERSDDATLVNPASNLREAITHQVNLEANLPHDPFMQEEGSDDATLVHFQSKLREHMLHVQSAKREMAIFLGNIFGSNLEEELPTYQSMQRDDYNATISLWKMFVTHLGLKIKLTFQTFRKLLYLHINHLVTCRPVLLVLEPISVIGRIMKSQKKFVGQYLENDEKVSNLIKTVEKLEKTAGDIGNFIELLKLQSKRNMCRKRKRSGVALQGFLLVISLKLQTYALLCYGEDPYLLVIMLFRANFNLPTGITGYNFIGYIM